MIAVLAWGIKDGLLIPLLTEYQRSGVLTEDRSLPTATLITIKSTSWICASDIGLSHLVFVNDRSSSCMPLLSRHYA